MLNHALKYASYGWHVFPCKLDKSPLTKTGFKEATTDPEQIKKWWTENHNASIGCACGPDSKIWVVDIDLPEGPDNWQKLIDEYGQIETMEQITGSGGRQLFFSYNGTTIRNSASKIAKDIDSRGVGGYCILPPSPHPSGGVYKWQNKIKPAKAPDWLLGLLKTSDAIPIITATDKTDLYAQKALANEIVAVSMAGNGARNDTLNKAAFSLGQLIAGGCLNEGHAMAGLLGAATAAGLPAKEARATISSGFRSGASNPRTAPELDDDRYYFADDEEPVKPPAATTDEKLYARGQVSNALAKGQLIRGEVCQLCGSKDRIQAHHNDYSKPLDVVWICHSCHQRLHRDLPKRDKPYQQNQQNQQNHSKSATVSNSKQESAEVSSGKQESAETQAYNLTALITEYVKNSSGSFTIADIDREFCLKNRKEKNNRSRVLNKLINTNLIYRDKSVNGKYHILDSGLDVIDLEAPAEESFPIKLPFGIHHKVIIPPHGIILLAGSSNAGKTAFVLNTLWLNREQDYKKLYLMSEMGNGEYITRIKKFSPSWKAEWKNITAASRASDFQGAVKHHNPNGLTCIDYLEESGGEYFKIASNIRDVYDSIGDGVVFIAIQKQSKSEVGRGGEGTLEKARLYMTLDYLATGEKSIICSLQLRKVKNYIDKNLQGYEIHFRLSDGYKIDQITDWMMSSRVDRDAYRKKYEQEVDLIPEKTDPGDIIMVLADGTIRRITDKTSRQWQEQFYTFDVRKELERISMQSKGKPFLTTNYFFQISGILKKKHDAEVKRLGG